MVSSLIARFSFARGAISCDVPRAATRNYTSVAGAAALVVAAVYEALLLGFALELAQLGVERLVAPLGLGGEALALAFGRARLRSRELLRLARADRRRLLLDRCDR